MAKVNGQPDAPISTPEKVAYEHYVFYSQDEIADDGSGVYYRERLISVAPGTPEIDAKQLVVDYYHRLTGDGSPDDHKRLINIQIYDHEFDLHSQKPAIVTLTWKEWTQKQPKILFPLSGNTDPAPVEGKEKTPSKAQVKEQTPSKVQVKEQTPSRARGKGQNRAIPLAKVTVNPKPVTEPEPVEALPFELTVRLKKAGVKETKPRIKLKAGRKEPTPEDYPMVAAFERMQEIFDVRTHDKAAAFALNLSRELIGCESGSCMLISPSKYELYVSAAEGPTAKTIKGRKLSLTEGIVGAATRAGVAVYVPDVSADPRFDDGLDKETGFTTRNVLCAPVQHEGRIRGVVELVNSSSKDGFKEMDRHVLAYIGEALAKHIDTALPSRQADFTDKDFSEWLPPSTAKRNAKKKT